MSTASIGDEWDIADHPGTLVVARHREWMRSVMNAFRASPFSMSAVDWVLECAFRRTGAQIVTNRSSWQLA